MYLLSPFILQNFERILRADPELSGCAIFWPQIAHLSLNKFFCYKPLLLLSSTCLKFLQQIHSYEDAPLFCPKWYIYPIFFFGKLLISFSSDCQPLSLCNISKKNPSSGSSVMMIRNVWLTGYALTGFFRKPVNEPCSFHSCHAYLYMPKVRY